MNICSDLHYSEHVFDCQYLILFLSNICLHYMQLYDIMKQNHLLASVILQNALSELCSRHNECKRVNMLAGLTSDECRSYAELAYDIMSASESTCLQD